MRIFLMLVSLLQFLKEESVNYLDGEINNSKDLINTNCITATDRYHVEPHQKNNFHKRKPIYREGA